MVETGRDREGETTVLGLDVGGTKTAVVEGTADGEILQRRQVATEARYSFGRVFPVLSGLMREVIYNAERQHRRIGAISVSVGGPLRIDEGVLIDPPHLPGWHGIRLKDRLSDAFPGVPVFIEHDGNAGALAEFYFGVGESRRDLRHLIFLTFGTGLGAGIISNGRILHGASDTAGEVGHWRLAPEGPVGFGKAGSWEGFASGQGLVEMASRMYPARWTPEMPIREVVDAMLNDDDSEAHDVAREAGEWMGRGMALLVDAFNPQLIVLGSLAVVLGDRVLEPARRILAREALPQAAAACEVVPSRLGRYIGDVSAIMAALTAPEFSQRLVRFE